MVEAPGGRFWRHYGPELDALLQQTPAGPSGSGAPAGMNPALFEQRPPIDLADPRVRTLAAALGPAYVRVSGTWANSTWLADSDAPPAAAPKGFTAVLTRAQWKGVLDFVRAVDGRLVTSFATSAGARDESGVWTPRAARAFVDDTHSLGGRIAAAEFMNEPNLAAMGAAPAGYDAAAYGRDFKAFRAFAREAAPEMLILGPGSVGEGGLLSSGRLVGLASRELLSAAGPGVDAFSYHHYGAVSKRCARVGQGGTTPEDALSEAWLARTDAAFGFYKSLRDELEPGKPIWLTETADILVISTDKTASRALRIPVPATRYTLSSSELQSARVQLNGRALAWDGKGALPRLSGAPTAAGDVTFAPATISFLAVAGAANGACR